MKSFISVFFCILVTIPSLSFGWQPDSSSTDTTMLSAAYESPRKTARLNNTSRRSGKSDTLDDAASLSRALELPTSDSVISDDVPDGFDQFELKIPDYDLPASDIPLTINRKVEYFITYFQTTGRTWFAKWLSRSERYIPMMKSVLKKEGLPEDLVYLAMIESGFSTHACSHANAVGPWQFIAGTGKRYALKIDSWVDERRDPLKSTIAAALYLKELYSLFNKDWYLAAAGYNAGENKILRAIDMYNTRDFWQISEGEYLKRETKDYVPKLVAAAIIAKDPAKYGFADVAYLPPIEFDTVLIDSRTDLELVARLLGVSLATVRELNPELKKGCTPPDVAGYALKIPKGTKDLFQREYARIPADGRFKPEPAFSRYRAGRGDSINSLARRFGVSVERIAAINGLTPRSRLNGRVLKIPAESVGTIVSPPRETTKEKKTVARNPDDKSFVKYYTVKHGDTLSSVARRFNVSAKIIAAWNNLRGKIALKPGKRIIVARYVEKKGQMVPQQEDKG
jgi:membrane-bound lytic murein transglycosylase D